MDGESFWRIRADRYDQLYWTRDEDYLAAIVDAGSLEREHLALDVGTGSGVIARAIRSHVDHVVAIDLSNAMLEKGTWEGISSIRWDIGECLFTDAVFDRVFARMVFHHVLENLDRAVLRCFDVLKPGGRIVVAEGLPATDDPEVVDWYTEMFKLKEHRRTFVAQDLVSCLSRNGFRNVQFQYYYMESFSIKNWLDNSGLPAEANKAIMDMHRNASEKVKDDFNMRFEGDDCLVRTRNAIVVGER